MTKVSGFQPHTTNVPIIFNFPKKVHIFTPHEIWLEPKSCLCSICHNFVKNYYFDLKFAVYLAITFHYYVLKGFFNTMIRVVVVGARSRLAFFCNRG